MPTPQLSKELAQAAVDAFNKAGTIAGAAKSLGIAKTTFEGRLQAAERYGMHATRKNLTGTSTLYGANGEVKLQWVKEHANQDQAQWEAAVKDVFADTAPVACIPMRKIARTSDLLAVYPIGDHHCGMYAWGAETGADYDIKIARKLLVSAVHHLLSVTPDTETGLLINVGDFFHVDNLKNETSRSHHTLDVDTRYGFMIEAGVDMLRTAINLGLQKHKYMRVICTPGNHDDIGAQWLSLTLAMLYSSNPRVIVDRTPGKFHYYNHGKVLIGVTHGDTGKPGVLGGVMAADQPALWGTTKHRYWFTGHVHNRTVVELPGVMWETFRTLAARDGWAQSSGYRSGRDMMSIVMHKDHGEVARHRFDISMLRAA